MTGLQDGSSLPDPGALAALLANHRAFLEFLERRVGSRAVAEDLLQEAFVRALERSGTLRDDERVVAWFYRVLRNAVIDHYRRNDASRRALEAVASEVGAAEEPPESWRAEACRCVLRLATTLKPEYARALQRIEVDGLAVHEFAQEAGISRQNAAVRVFRAREALRRQIALSCRTCADHGCLDCVCAS
jgi:RNA polymerase sigma-70 factor (ECF subfamily)